ncbi:MAG: single-stranded DNA-binding protein [Anaerolineae bacterium]
MYQNLTIVGNVGRVSDLRFTQGGVAVVDFTVAVNKRYTDGNNQAQEKTTWFRVTCWRRLAETMAQYLKVGRQVMVVGEVEVNAYLDKSGQPAATLEVTAREVKFLGTRDGGDGGGSGGGYDDDFAPRGNAPSDMNDIPF